MHVSEDTLETTSIRSSRAEVTGGCYPPAQYGCGNQTGILLTDEPSFWPPKCSLNYEKPQQSKVVRTHYPNTQKNWRIALSEAALKLNKTTSGYVFF